MTEYGHSLRIFGTIRFWIFWNPFRECRFWESGNLSLIPAVDGYDCSQRPVWESMFWDFLSHCFSNGLINKKIPIPIFNTHSDFIFSFQIPKSIMSSDSLTSIYIDTADPILIEFCFQIPVFYTQSRANPILVRGSQYDNHCYSWTLILVVLLNSDAQNLCQAQTQSHSHSRSGFWFWWTPPHIDINYHSRSEFWSSNLCHTGIP